MYSKNLIKKATALLMAAVVSTGAIFAQAVTPKQNDKGKWGIVDNTGKWVAKAEYAAIEPYGNGYYRVQKDGKWGVYFYDNDSKEKVLDCKYSTILKAGTKDNLQFVAQEKDKPEKWVISAYVNDSFGYKWKKYDLKEASVNDMGAG